MAGAERRRISTWPDVIGIRNYDGLRPRHALAKEGFELPEEDYLRPTRRQPAD